MYKNYETLAQKQGQAKDFFYLTVVSHRSEKSMQVVFSQKWLHGHLQDSLL